VSTPVKAVLVAVGFAVFVVLAAASSSIIGNNF